MALNITGMHPPHVRGGYSGQVTSPKVDKLPDSGMLEKPVRAPDELQLTPESLQLRKLETALKGESAIDTERVEALRKAIASGEYKVNSASVARKMLDFEGELFK
jgi:flagellar biosynthesis anti-sigma factor FlgM